MVINKDNYKVNNAYIFKDIVLNMIIDLENKELTFNMKDTFNNLGEYALKFINVLGYNMTSFDFIENDLSISDFYINIENKKYEYSLKYENLDLSNYMEFVIEFNNDDFIKILCEKLEIDDRKSIRIAN